MTEKISVKRKIKSGALNAVMYFSAIIVMLLLFSVAGYVIYRGISSISIEFLTTKQSFIKDTVGILPNILNTLYVVVITLIIVLPIGIGAAIYLNEYANKKRFVRMIELAAETLAGIPSIVYALAGMLIFVRFFKLGTSITAGSLTLALMTLPTVIRTTEESLKAVPNGYREGALALGSGKWHMIRTVILPSAADGVVTGCILSVGRIVGESASLLFTAGRADEIYGFFEALMPKKSGATLTVALYMYAKERGDFDTAFAIAVILLALTLVINLSAKVTARLVKRRELR